MTRRREIEVATVAEAFAKVHFETLRALAQFVSPDAPSRKAEVVPYLTSAMTSEDTVRRLYDSFSDC